MRKSNAFVIDNRNKEIVSIRMRIGLKKEIDLLCKNHGITRNNFIVNCILKELNSSKCKKKYKMFQVN